MADRATRTRGPNGCGSDVAGGRRPHPSAGRTATGDPALSEAVAAIRTVIPRIEEAVGGIVLDAYLDVFATDLAGWAAALNERSVALGATWTPKRLGSTPREWAARCFHHWMAHAGRHGTYVPVPEPRACDSTVLQG